MHNNRKQNTFTYRYIGKLKKKILAFSAGEVSLLLNFEKRMAWQDFNKRGVDGKEDKLKSN